MVERAGVGAGFEFKVHPHMLRAPAAMPWPIDTRAIQDWLGHVSITHTTKSLRSARFASRTSGAETRGLPLTQIELPKVMKDL
jgi:integrase